MTPGALLLVCGSFLLFCLLYYGSAYLGDFASARYHLYFAWEKSIPLVPSAAFVYLSEGLMYFPIFRKQRTFAQLWPLALTLAVEQVVAAACFLAFPLEDGFPCAPPPGGISGAVCALAGRLAGRHNYFPSLHVTLATTAALVYARVTHSRALKMHLWAAAIASSTLLIHQHHIADVLAGLTLAWASVRLVYDRLLPASTTDKPA